MHQSRVVLKSVMFPQKSLCFMLKTITIVLKCPVQVSLPYEGQVGLHTVNALTQDVLTQLLILLT
jgi:hypothetical protein